MDLVTAGIPCQGYSLAGKRRLQHDERDLWADTIRIVEECGARWLLVENVRGLLVPGADVGAGITRILGELAERGWDAEWLGLRASDVGASHGRFRVFILAHRRCDGGSGRGGSRELAETPSETESEAWERERMRYVAGNSGEALPHFAPGPADPSWATILSERPYLRPSLSRAEAFAAGAVVAGYMDPAAVGMAEPAPPDARRLGAIVARALASSGRSKEAQRQVRGLAHGMASHRRERLRLLGNGVVEVQGAVAVRELFQRLIGL